MMQGGAPVLGWCVERGLVPGQVLRTSCELAVASGLIDRLGNGRFAREFARKAAAERDLRIFDLHGSSGVPSQGEVTTLHVGDVMDAYRELTQDVPLNR